MDVICTNCGAVLNNQSGFHPRLKRWICTCCRQPLFSDEKDEGIVTWFCDKCNAVLNEQDGFQETEVNWICKACGFKNDLSEYNIYDNITDYINRIPSKSRKLKWRPFNNGKTIGKIGYEKGFILADEECEGYGRISLETFSKYDAISCCVYGTMIYTVYRNKSVSFMTYQSMKVELMDFFENDLDDPQIRFEFCEKFTKKFWIIG